MYIYIQQVSNIPIQTNCMPFPRFKVVTFYNWKNTILTILVLVRKYAVIWGEQNVRNCLKDGIHEIIFKDPLSGSCQLKQLLKNLLSILITSCIRVIDPESKQARNEARPLSYICAHTKLSGLYTVYNSKLDLLYPYGLLPSLTILSPPLVLEVNFKACKKTKEGMVTVVEETCMQGSKYRNRTNDCANF